MRSGVFEMKPAMITVSSDPQERGARTVHARYASLLRKFCSEVLPIVTTSEELEKLEDRLRRLPLVFTVVATGGTSDLILKIAEYTRVVMLTHGKQNSLASALNATIRLKRRGIYTKVIHELSTDTLREIAVISQAADVLSRIKELEVVLFCAPEQWARERYGVEFLESLGMKLTFVNPDEFIERYESAMESIKLLKRFLEVPSVDVTQEDVSKVSKILAVVLQYMQEHGTIICAFRCFPFLKKTGITPCLVLSYLLDRGVTAACEGDLSSMLMMEILRLLSGRPAFMANIEDVTGNMLFLAHCTVATTILRTYVLRTHFETGYGVSIAGIFDDNLEVTVANFSPDFKEMFVGRGIIKDGKPKSEECCRTQVLIEMTGDLQTLLDEPVNRHLCVAIGNYEAHLKAIAEMLGIKVRTPK